MKSHKSSPKRSAAIAAPVAFLLALGLLSLYHSAFSPRRYPRVVDVASSSSSSSSSSSGDAGTCDLTRGEWVPEAAGAAPYYTNLTCPFIDDLQNCMKFGKPSLDFVRWRWRPDGCELPRFNAARFLDAMRGKSIAFVGDSLARNHFKSLLCLLSSVAQPAEVVGAAEREVDATGRVVRRDFYYGSHDFTASLFWSPFLVRANLSNATIGMWDVHLDEPDARWAAHVASFDHVVLSGTNWFLRPSVYHERGRAVARNNNAIVRGSNLRACRATGAARGVPGGPGRHRGRGRRVRREGGAEDGDAGALRERGVEHGRRLRAHAPVPAR